MSLNSPSTVVAAGVAVLAGMPWLQQQQTLLLGGWSTSTIQFINVLAYTTNVIAVSIPGRLDGPQDEQMRKQIGLSPIDTTSTTTTTAATDTTIVLDVYNERSLVTPSGWAFAIWGPIYFGEAIFSAYVQFYALSNSDLRQISAPFLAMNLLQSLWCASFRPQYFFDNNNKNPQQGGDWTKFVSVMMLGSTVYSLSHIGSMSNSNWMLLPFTLHFGWTTAATLVNFNGSIASISSISNEVVIAAGHSAAVLATGIGLYVTIVQSLPVYGFTIAWALAACSTGAIKKSTKTTMEKIVRASQIQEKLCLFGAITCFLTSVVVWYGSRK
jgi:hypothetical protein